MSQDEIANKSGAVAVIAHRPHWAGEFTQLGRRIRELVGAAALRIDHIGSTAVPGLAAKDVIDIQITVADLDGAGPLTSRLATAGFRLKDAIQCDQFHGLAATDPHLRKLYFREPLGERRTHIHIRELGRFNQRYALLFRDYLRAAPSIADEYALFKQRAAQLFPDSIDGYLDLKEPVFHILYASASLWAEKVAWRPDEDYL